MARTRQLGFGRRGQMVVMAAVSMAALLGFLGLVIDVGRMYVVRQQLRNACDAAVGAGASRIPMQPAAALKLGYEYYCRNAGGTPPASPANDTDYTIEGTGDVVHMITPYQGNNKRVYCSARRTVHSVFMQVLGIRSQEVGAYAVGLQVGRQSYVSLLASNYSGIVGGVSTQYIDRTRADGQRYAIVIEGNNLTLGVDGNSNLAGLIATSQNTYVDTNNSVGKAMYGDTDFANYGKGNEKTSPELLNPAPGAPGGMVFLDPNYYLRKAQEQGANRVLTGNKTWQNRKLNGFYFIYGDLYIGKEVTGTATIAATGKITTGETRVTKADLTYADTENKILFYAGADPTLDPATYFTSARYDPNNRMIHLNDNNTEYTGTMYAPYGRVVVESNMTTIRGSLVGDTIGITQYANNVTVFFDQTIPPPVAPGMLLIE